MHLGSDPEKPRRVLWTPPYGYYYNSAFAGLSNVFQKISDINRNAEKMPLCMEYKFINSQMALISPVCMAAIPLALLILESVWRNGLHHGTDLPIVLDY